MTATVLKQAFGGVRNNVSEMMTGEGVEMFTSASGPDSLSPYEGAATGAFTSASAPVVETAAPAGPAASLKSCGR